MNNHSCATVGRHVRINTSLHINYKDTERSYIIVLRDTNKSQTVECRPIRSQSPESRAANGLFGWMGHSEMSSSSCSIKPRGIV